MRNRMISQLWPYIILIALGVYNVTHVHCALWECGCCKFIHEMNVIIQAVNSQCSTYQKRKAKMTQHSPLAIGEEQLGMPPRSCRNAVLFSKHNRNQIHVTFSYLIGAAMFLQQEPDSYRETTDNLVLHSCYQLLWHLERTYKSCNSGKTPRVTHGKFFTPWVTHGQNYVFQILKGMHNIRVALM